MEELQRRMIIKDRRQETTVEEILGMEEEVAIQDTVVMEILDTAVAGVETLDTVEEVEILDMEEVVVAVAEVLGMEVEVALVEVEEVVVEAVVDQVVLVVVEGAVGVETDQEVDLVVVVVETEEEVDLVVGVVAAEVEMGLEAVVDLVGEGAVVAVIMTTTKRRSDLSENHIKKLSFQKAHESDNNWCYASLLNLTHRT